MIKITPDERCMVNCPAMGRKIPESDCSGNCEYNGGYFDQRQIICYYYERRKERIEPNTIIDPKVLEKKEGKQ